jgi:hypothetical protein
MQNESESWEEPIVESLGAANPAFCASRIKREIPDMAGMVLDDVLNTPSSFSEYMGRQPEFIECVDFTPLIDPTADPSFSESNNNFRSAGAPPAKRKPPPVSLIMRRFLVDEAAGDGEQRRVGKGDKVVWCFFGNNVRLGFFWLE